MDKNFLLIGLGFAGGIVITNIAIAYGKKMYYDYKYKQYQGANVNRGKGQNSQNSQNSQFVKNQNNQQKWSVSHSMNLID